MGNPDELLEPFITAVATALREMAGAEVVVRDTFHVTSDEGLADVSAALRLEATPEGWLILSLPQATADALARRVLAEVGGVPDEAMVRDCVAELLNVIAGQAKALEYGTPRHFTLSTPTVLTPGLAERIGGRHVVRFDSDAGEFTLQVCPPGGAAGQEG